MGFKEPSFADRQSAAQNARKSILEKFKAKPAADDPAVLKRQGERVAQAEERAKAQKQREAAKLEKKAREAELAAQAQGQPQQTIALTDGSLLYWFLESLPVEGRDRIWALP